MRQGFETGATPADAETVSGGPAPLTTPAAGSSDSGSGLFVPPPAEALDGLLSQFKVSELLGRGGMGAVYKAHHGTLDRHVAIKILPPQIGRNPAFAERFSREAKALAKLSHPNIVAVFDAGHIDLPDENPVANTQPGDKLYYFVMEFVDGVSLRQVVRDGKLRPEDALGIVPQVCEALQYAHDEGIVHRDIKPDNILMDTRGRVKIADFGLAKLLGKSEHEVTLTHTHQRMGTPAYMAPEQHEWSAAVDHRADIYSLGVVFYEMLTGSLPMGRFDPPSKKVQVDVRLDEIVLRTLENEPDRRYQTASEIKVDVERIDTPQESASAAPRSGGAGLEEHPASAALRFAMTPQPGYGRAVGIPLLILVAIYMVAMVVIALTVSHDDVAILGLAMIGGTLLIIVTGLFLHVRWALVGRHTADAVETPGAGVPAPAGFCNLALIGAIMLPWGLPVLWHVVMLTPIGDGKRQSTFYEGESTSSSSCRWASFCRSSPRCSVTCRSPASVDPAGRWVDCHWPCSTRWPTPSCSRC